MAVADVKLSPSVVADRVKMVVQAVLRPAMVRDRAPLALSVAQMADPVPYAAAIRRRDYRPATVPFRWGPAWSTAWLRVNGRVPRHWAGGAVVLHVVLNGEALVWRDGAPWHGVSPCHPRIPLIPRCRGGEPVRLYLEAAANQLFGFLADAPPDHADSPALISTLELALLDPDVFRMVIDLEFAADLLSVSTDLLNPNRNWGGFTPPILSPPATRRLARMLDQALNGIREQDLPATLPAAHRMVSDALRAPVSADATESRTVGHSHIDVAWLWPLRETRRKCSRTFSTMLRHMERDPDFVYLQSQAQLYAFVEQDYPALMPQIKRRVKQGRWEAGGGMWVEADCNLASGEALVRQLLHGIRYWQKLFGPQYRHRYLWLPDVFGYSAALPQILRHCGIDTFFTQKISWNETNRFPHTTFWWQGIDGSRVLAHFFPSDNYNGQVTPRELLRADYNNQQSDLVPFWLNPVGYGDGGGGANDEILQRARTARRAPLLPAVRYQLPGAFSDDLHRVARNRPLPEWRGELYLELHRGTLTTQAQAKHCNRLAELGLRDVELWSSLAWGVTADYPAAALDRMWKTALLHQFHDVLPGSSIGWVYADTHRDYAALLLEIVERGDAARRALAARRPPPQRLRQPVAVFNAAETARSEVLEVPVPPSRAGRQKNPAAERLAYIGNIPGLGVAWLDAADAGELPPAVAPVKATARTLDNGILRLRLDAAGRVASMVRAASGRNAVPAGHPMNQLVLYADRPNQWDAWDINQHYLRMGDPVTGKADMRLVLNSPLRAEIEVRRRIGKASSMIQRIRLDAGSPRVDFMTWIDWHDRHCLLRVLHPVDVVSDHATCEIQFGHVRRPTHFNTSWDAARFEAPAHSWMDLSERGFGVALLNNAKYGHSCIGNVMGLSLLRAPTKPDEQADIGNHQFTYSLMPHDGDPISDGVPEAARALNLPLRALAMPNTQSNDPAPENMAATQWLDVPPGIRVECFKQAEEGGAWIVRLVDMAGIRRTLDIPWRIPIREVRAVNALEEPTRIFQVRFNPRRNVMRVPFTPFAIRTLQVRI